MTGIIIFGAGKSAQMMRVYLERETSYDVAGFTVDPEYVKSTTFDVLPLVSWDSGQTISTRAV